MQDYRSDPPPPTVVVCLPLRLKSILLHAISYPRGALQHVTVIQIKILLL